MSIPPPEPDLSQEQIVKRAQDMVAVLRKRQEECEELGRLPDQTSQDFIDAGFYRILQPRRFGGYCRGGWVPGQRSMGLRLGL